MKNPDIYHEHIPELGPLWNESMAQFHGVEGHPDSYNQSLKEVLIYGTLLRRYQIQPEGILYVGANCGQLLWVWLLLGFRNVLMIEPQPEVIPYLESVAKAASGLSLIYDRFLGCEDATRIQLAQCAVGEQEGEAELYVMSQSQLSSLLKPNESLLRPGGQSGDISVVDHLKVPVRTIDGLLQELEAGASPRRYNALYMNIQGGELKALRGAPKALETLEFIYLENNFEARYDGTPTADELTGFLSDFGFEAKWGMIQPTVGNGFTAYVKTPRHR